MTGANVPARPASLSWAAEANKPPHRPHANQPAVTVARTPCAQLPGEHGEWDTGRSAVELAQRGRMILDVSAVDLEAAERLYGPFHPTTWHFRNALGEAQRTWARLRAELGTKFLEAALEQPPLVVLTLGESQDRYGQIDLVLINGQTYQTQVVAGTDLAPIQWRLTHLTRPLDQGPYYICRLADGSTQCDCAEWTYRIAETNLARNAHCKHIAALTALGWI
jgi:hypothetical protein